jgi:hypothetical protein
MIDGFTIPSASTAGLPADRVQIEEAWRFRSNVSFVDYPTSPGVDQQMDDACRIRQAAFIASVAQVAQR